ncbi:FMRF-Like Peptide [Caenorhabditis elegans]|uniref:FMRF-Like Peptide n=1 Tax=Caenorhabditis elegans TaxID=6239 RepID=G5EF22_CAEEL|nr:FMRF-Like Peptide [Caenorhabditis elegans]AAC08947.1 FMRFamide-like peptide 10 [Caenorhabditis elegans]CCD63311.1 FMRF-Like Peptide [Caenorhabditis elegans]|eukprot:NP_501306.1 FMRF-Like Peptide [Caenorhabditis elegans]
MQLSIVFVFFVLCLAAVFAVPISDASRARRQVASEKRQPKARSGYIRFGKRRVDPNAELLYLDQLLI